MINFKYIFEETFFESDIFQSIILIKYHLQISNTLNQLKNNLFRL